MGVRIMIGVNLQSLDGNDWPRFEADGILSVWNSKAHAQHKLSIQNETDAITILHQIRVHRRLSLWVPGDESHIVHNFYGAMQTKKTVAIVIDIFRLVTGGSPDGVIVFAEDFLAKVVNVLTAGNDQYIVNLKVAGGVTQETYDGDDDDHADEDA